MFEQALLPAGHTHQGRCAAFALTGEVGLLAIASVLMVASDIAPIRLPEAMVPLVLAPPPAAAPAPARTTAKVAKAFAAPKRFVAPVLATIPAHPMIITDPEPALQSDSGVPGGVIGGVPGGSLNGLLAALPAPAPLMSLPKPAPPPPPPAPTVPKRIRLGGDVEAALLTHQVLPAYPPLAKNARIQGSVRFSAVIAPDGTVTDLKLLSGQPLLVDAATNAVKQWVYRPTFLDGHPVEVLTEIEVKFSLQ